MFTFLQRIVCRVVLCGAVWCNCGAGLLYPAKFTATPANSPKLLFILFIVLWGKLFASQKFWPNSAQTLALPLPSPLTTHPSTHDKRPLASFSPLVQLDVQWS